MVAPPDAILFDLQNRSERVRLQQDPAALTRSLAPTGDAHRHVFIDEVQRVPELLDEIQGLLDRHPGKFTFTLTGSSARRLRRSEANLLPGRIHRFPLFPICLWECEAAGPCEILPAPRAAPARPFPRRSLEETLIFGGLPGAFAEGPAFRQTLAAYAEAYIEEEVLREMAARNLGAYGRFLELAAVESGRTIRLTSLSQDAGIPLSTVRGYYQVLEDTLLGFHLPPFAAAGRARLLKTPKFFLFDVGVRNALARLPLEASVLATQGGFLLEHWLACELFARAAYLGREFRLSSYRTVDGAEVDLILETPSEAIPIEVKYTERPRPEDARSVEAFLRRFPDRARRGFVVCRAPRPEQLTDRVRAIPWDRI